MGLEKNVARMGQIRKLKISKKLTWQKWDKFSDLKYIQTKVWKKCGLNGTDL